MAENRDVIVQFWLEKDEEKISSGQDTIYLGEFEEKTEQTQIYLPKELESGEYQFYVQVSYENYQAVSFRTVYVEQGEEYTEVILIEEPEVQKPFNIFLFFAFTLFLVMILLLIVMHWRRKVLLNKIKEIKIDLSFIKKLSELLLKLFLKAKKSIPVLIKKIRKDIEKKKKVVKKKITKNIFKNKTTEKKITPKKGRGKIKVKILPAKNDLVVKSKETTELIDPVKQPKLYQRKFIAGIIESVLRKEKKKPPLP